MVNHDTVGVQAEHFRLGTFIRAHRTRILEDWEASVRRLPCTQGLSRPRLMDHLPDLLERIANVVDKVHTGGHGSLERMPEVHALERLDSGYDLDAVAEEYALLRACILQRYGEYVEAHGDSSMAVAMREVVSFNRTFDEAVSAAVSRYTRARERTLVALDRISEAALGAEELDAFLPRLLRVMLETTEAVDSVTLMLREGELLKVRASVGLEHGGAHDFSERVGEGFCGVIAAEQRPFELRSAATDPRVRDEALRARGTHALYGVPLMYGGEVIGVAHMGSRTAVEFSNEDKLLFRAMVSRATILIIQAWLSAREHAARAEAEERKQQLQLIIEQSSDAIIMADAQGVMRVFNTAAEQLHGFGFKEVPPSEWSGTYGLLTLDERPMKFEEVCLYRALQNEVVTEDRWKVRRLDGSVRTLIGTAAPLWRPDGSLAGAVLNARDETERLDREREQTETLALLDSLLATAPVGLAFLDPSLRFVRTNEALAEINGLSVDAHRGRTVEEVFGERAEWLVPLLRHVLETGEVYRGDEFSGCIAREPGALRHWVGDYFPVRARDGRMLGVGCVVVDVTERTLQEERLRQTAEFRERFLGVVSHDLRNPLNAILLSANGLLRTEGLPATHTKLARRIVTSAERMVRMIGELLDFTRGRLGGGIPIQPRPSNLRLLCNQVLEELESSHPGRELRLTAEGQFQGEWDPDRLAQLLGNLGKNALDYSPLGSSVDFSLHDEGEAVRVEVHNGGPPIPLDLLPNIFEPFRRAVSGDAHSTSGLGLGLFIVEQIAQAHGGTIGVHSTSDAGTCFTLRLPRKTHEAPPGASGASS
ncbi:ATP-binding protein [Melittangium boletus]|uniref:histidine kinase n=1 Tax=Melittangium boletus DSM 14713 TaxID=1294270 RepID=A0A250IA06_9BACT|nr:ATP-binding protein [Melittangium boletus]ATB28040.1 histidine kinase [Melittangium boletus DSM 14713]